LRLASPISHLIWKAGLDGVVAVGSPFEEATVAAGTSLKAAAAATASRIKADANGGEQQNAKGAGDLHLVSTWLAVHRSQILSDPKGTGQAKMVRGLNSTEVIHFRHPASTLLHAGFGSCDTEASSAFRRRPTVRVMKEGPSGSAIMS
jgi:hypothetical protein